MRKLIRGGTLVTVDANFRVFRGDLLVEDDKILRIAKRIAPKPDWQTVDARDCLVMPGLVQAHVHLCQTLFRGMADDLPLLDWLKNRIWPFEGAHDATSMRVSAELGLAEMIGAGTTTILDMGTVRHQDVIFRALERSGIRAFSGKAMMDKNSPKTLRETTKESLEESDKLCRRWQGKKGRLGYAYAPRFILSCSERLMREVAERSAENGALMHTHAAEHAAERKAVKEMLGQDDIAALESFGICGPRAVIAHGVQLRVAEMKRMAKLGTNIVHCPSANMKLASGFADVVKMQNAGMRVGIGADGAPCNNLMDPWVELREMALIAKVKQDNAAALSANESLRIATLGGAEVLGLEQQIGSLEEGKQADIAVIGPPKLHSLPALDPVARLVYATKSTDVRDVMVAGDWLVRNGEHQTLDVQKIVRSAPKQAMKVAARAGV